MEATRPRKASRSNDQARWPTDIVELRDSEMRGRLTALEPDLAPLRALVTHARHPWNLRFGLILVGGIIATVFLFTKVEALGWLSVISTLGGLVWAGSKALRFQEILDGHRETLDARLIKDVLQIDYPFLPDDPLAVYADTGCLPRYDRIQQITGFRHNSRDLIQTKLTERESYTDSDGKTQTRDVERFNGILFSLPFPEADGEARTLISTMGAKTPRGEFSRQTPQGRRVKMKAIKTSSLEFNKRHAVLTDDQVLGHAILDPDRIMRFINMEHDLSEKNYFGKQYAMLITQGRAWVVIKGVPSPDLSKFPEGDALADRLSKAHEAVSIPSVMAHHLRLPDEPDLSDLPGPEPAESQEETSDEL